MTQPTPPIPPELQPLAHTAFAEAARALRAREQRIIDRWESAVRAAIPQFHTLTHEEIRDHIPQTLDSMAGAFQAGWVPTDEAVQQWVREQARHRIKFDINLEQLVIEYRFLRRIMKEEVHAELSFNASIGLMFALDLGIDAAVQQAVKAFVALRDSKLRRAAETESRHLAFLSHDLRNHLNNIMMALDLTRTRLQSVPSFEEEANTLVTAQRVLIETVQAMDRMVHTERIRNQSVKPVFVLTNLRQLAAESAAQLTPAAQLRNLTFDVRVPANAELITDRQILSLALYNIIFNATKYASAGAIRIDAAPVQQDSRSGWQLSISDQGPGIPRDQIDILFTAYQRGETQGQPGAGLGLAIAAQAIRMLNGKIDVQSPPDQGTTFLITLFPPAGA